MITLQQMLLISITFFDQSVKNKQEAYEKLIEIPRNDDFTTKNLLNYLYHKYYYKIIANKCQ